MIPFSVHCRYYLYHGGGYCIYNQIRFINVAKGYDLFMLSMCAVSRGCYVIVVSGLCGATNMKGSWWRATAMPEMVENGTRQ